MLSQEQLVEKWSVLVQACKNYYIDSKPTGMSDAEFDKLEIEAAQDGFFVRDYVFKTYLKGAKTMNNFIEKIKKTKVEGCSMLDAIKEKEKEIGEKIYCDLKYDGSSIAIYLDPYTGKPHRIVTVGNLNIDNFGVDQTWKLMSFLPKRFPLGIVAIQCEALIDLDRFGDSDPDTARQKANGLINSTKEEAQYEVNSLLTLRAYRYYSAPFCDVSEIIENGELMDYRKVLSMFEVVRSPIDGHILFSPADTWTVEELDKNKNFTETGKTRTSTGYFLNDGWVLYSKTGTCLGALKYSGAGKDTETIKTKVEGIQWNNQVSKGKDSWSANVIIDPVVVRGCTIKKPSAGSVSKLVKKNITPGAEVSIILANSTIPMVGEVYKEGDGNFNWPKCSCGYQMSEKDIYGSLLKCGNPHGTERLNRMRSFISQFNDLYYQFCSKDLNNLLVIDRFKWENSGIVINDLFDLVKQNDTMGYYQYLKSFLKTDLQIRNLDLVWQASFKALRENYENSVRN